MQTRSWDGQDGQKKYRTEIVADRIQFGSRSTGAPSAGSAMGAGAAGSKSEPMDDPKDMPAGGVIEYPEEEINPDDIPF